MRGENNAEKTKEEKENPQPISHPWSEWDLKEEASTTTEN